MVQLEQARPIIVNGQYGKLIYKALQGSESVKYAIDDIPQSPMIAVKVDNGNISNINLSIVRSDDGTPYPFADNDEEGVVSILLQITPLTQPLIPSSTTSQ